MALLHSMFWEFWPRCNTLANVRITTEKNNEHDFSKHKIRCHSDIIEHFNSDGPLRNTRRTVLHRNIFCLH